jgi:hypothetical protein
MYKHNFLAKNCPKFWAIRVHNFEKMPEEKNRSIGENSPHLVTLLRRSQPRRLDEIVLKQFH